MFLCEPVKRRLPVVFIGFLQKRKRKGQPIFPVAALIQFKWLQTLIDFLQALVLRAGFLIYLHSAIQLHLHGDQHLQQCLTIFHVGNPVNIDAKGIQKVRAILLGNQQIALQPLAADEIRHLLNAMQLLTSLV